MTGTTNKENIVVDILGHPRGAPSLEELDYMNPEKGREEICRQLQALISDDVVRTLKVDVDVDAEDAPERLYSLTEDVKAEYVDTEKAWRRQYASVEKTERIEELEALQSIVSFDELIDGDVVTERGLEDPDERSDGEK